jgi:sugar transferase (PEP-CTERM system associated)
MVKREKRDSVRVVPYSEFRQFAARNRVARIVIADPELEASNELAETLMDCKLRGVKVETAVDSFEKSNRKIWLEGLSPEWVIFSAGFSPSETYLAAKRVMDIMFAILLLIVLAPLMGLVALAICLDSHGGAVFSQERVGLLGKKFTVYKFRSMRLDAEKAGPAWATAKDDRCTRIGRFLRKCRLDELPQIYNVLRGDMSFVGPRPERPYFVDMLKQNIRYYDLRHYAKPGITGWAQVMYRYGASVEDAYQKLQYDLYYAKNVSFRLDMLVLLKTIKVVLHGEGQ